jgi:predicted metal-binding protein
MKKFDPKFTLGSLFICSKCGQGFNSPDQAEKLKSELRTDLKKNEAHTKVRVMVSGCLGICEPDQQTFAYYPNSGNAEIFTTDKNFDTAKNEIFGLIQNKIKS